MDGGAGRLPPRKPGEIFLAILDAGLNSAEPPSNDSFPAIWDSWNARSPREQVEDSVTANEALLTRLEGLDTSQLDAFKVSMFGMDVDAERLLRMRLSEHALHAWDVAVAFDDSAEVAPGAVALLVDGLGQMVARGRGSEHPSRVAVTTTRPERSFVLDTGAPSLTAGDASTPAVSSSLELPAEALVRLVYGRLSDVHPPHGPVSATGVELRVLIEVFPGF